MFQRSSFPPQRPGLGRVDLVVLTSIVLMAVLLTLPACRRYRVNENRMQSTNNLKQIGLAAQSFHDTNKRWPFNGIAPGTKAAHDDSTYYGNAVSSCPTSGSWLFQILPYCDQQDMFQLLGEAGSDVVPVRFRIMGLATYLCPGRGRPPFEDGKGPWSDYFINNYLNDATQADKPDNPDAKMTMVQITDGTSNTIFAGQGNIATTDYTKTANVPGSSNIFVGGTQGTMRGGPKWVKGSRPMVAMQRDAATLPPLADGGWGGPFPQGTLMVFADATVRLLPYSTTPDVVGALMTPVGDEGVELPD